MNILKKCNPTPNIGWVQTGLSYSNNKEHARVPLDCVPGLPDIHVHTCAVSLENLLVNGMLEECKAGNEDSGNCEGRG